VTLQWGRLYLVTPALCGKNLRGSVVTILCANVETGVLFRLILDCFFTSLCYNHVVSTAADNATADNAAADNAAADNAVADNATADNAATEKLYIYSLIHRINDSK